MGKSWRRRGSNNNYNKKHNNNNKEQQSADATSAILLLSTINGNNTTTTTTTTNSNTDNTSNSTTRESSFTKSKYNNSNKKNNNNKISNTNIPLLWNYKVRNEISDYLYQYRTACVTVYTQAKTKAKQSKSSLNSKNTNTYSNDCTESSIDNDNNISESNCITSSCSTQLIGGHGFVSITSINNNSSILYEPYLSLPITLSSKERRIVHELCLEHNLYHETITTITTVPVPNANASTSMDTATNSNDESNCIATKINDCSVNNEDSENDNHTNDESTTTPSTSTTYMVVSIYLDGFDSIFTNSTINGSTTLSSSHGEEQLQSQSIQKPQEENQLLLVKQQQPKLYLVKSWYYRIEQTQEKLHYYSTNAITKINQLIDQPSYCIRDGSSTSTSTMLITNDTNDINNTTTIPLDNTTASSTNVLNDCIDTINYTQLEHVSLSCIDPPSIYDDTTSTTMWMLVDTPTKMRLCIQELNNAFYGTTSTDTKNKKNATELAFDIECYNVSKYTQLTCLLQITTNHNKHYIIDPISYASTKTTINTTGSTTSTNTNDNDTNDDDMIYEINKLNIFFNDPTIVKIGHSVHGLDIKSLYRDFGIYVINIFDTYEAVQKLVQVTCNYPLSYSLASVCDYYKLQHPQTYYTYKQLYQNCDWTIRPLTNEQLLYSRYDIHYLILLRQLLIRDLTKNEFIQYYNSNNNVINNNDSYQNSNNNDNDNNNNTTTSSSSRINLAISNIQYNTNIINTDVRSQQDSTLINDQDEYGNENIHEDNDNDATRVAQSLAITLQQFQHADDDCDDEYYKDSNINHLSKSTTTTSTTSTPSSAAITGTTMSAVPQTPAAIHTTPNDDEGDNCTDFKTPFTTSIVDVSTDDDDDDTNKNKTIKEKTIEYDRKSLVSDLFMTPCASLSEYDTITRLDTTIKNTQEDDDDTMLFSDSREHESSIKEVGDNKTITNVNVTPTSNPPSTPPTQYITPYNNERQTTIKKSNVTKLPISDTTDRTVFDSIQQEEHNQISTPNFCSTSNGKQLIATAADLRMQLLYMSVLSISQERCKDLWKERNAHEPFLENPTFVSMLYRTKKESKFNNNSTTNKKPTTNNVWTSKSIDLYHELVLWRSNTATKLQCLPGLVVPLNFLVLVAWKCPQSINQLRLIQYILPPLLQDDNNYCNEIIKIVIDNITFVRSNTSNSTSTTVENISSSTSSSSAVITPIAPNIDEYEYSHVKDVLHSEKERCMRNYRLQSKNNSRMDTTLSTDGTSSIPSDRKQRELLSLWTTTTITAAAILTAVAIGAGITITILNKRRRL